MCSLVMWISFFYKLDQLTSCHTCCSYVVNILWPITWCTCIYNYDSDNYASYDGMLYKQNSHPPVNRLWAGL